MENALTGSSWAQSVWVRVGMDGSLKLNYKFQSFLDEEKYYYTLESIEHIPGYLYVYFCGKLHEYNGRFGRYSVNGTGWRANQEQDDAVEPAQVRSAHVLINVVMLCSN